ncbi:LOW QUALITY PROTEIN: SAC3 domain-containing protein, partial [Cephalotus follicularis]
TKEINLLKTLSMFKEHSINLIKTKENHLYFMKQEMSNKKLEQQLQTSQIQEKFNSLKNNIINNLCSELFDAFWHKKRHVVSLPYEQDFTEQKISTKARPIQMNHELMEHCKKEIEELLNKKLIRPSKSPWSKFPDIITDKKQLQRFLGSLNYIRDFISNLQLCIHLYKRLTKTPPRWTNEHTQLIKQIKLYAKKIPSNSILTKDVKNLASKQIFARWQGIQSSFYFTIEHIKGNSNSLPDYLTREFLQ